MAVGSAQGQEFIKGIMANGRRPAINGAASGQVVPIQTGPPEPLEVLAAEVPPTLLTPGPSPGKTLIISFGPRPGTYVLVIEDREQVLISRTVEAGALAQMRAVLEYLVPVRDWTGGALELAEARTRPGATGAGTRRTAGRKRSTPRPGGDQPDGESPPAV